MFKRFSLKKLKMSGEEVRAATRQGLAELDLVKAALDDAQAQLKAYRRALEERYGEVLRLRVFAVVALGFERLVVRELTEPAR